MTGLTTREWERISRARRRRVRRLARLRPHTTLPDIDALVDAVELHNLVEGSFLPIPHDHTLVVRAFNLGARVRPTASNGTTLHAALMDLSAPYLTALGLDDGD